MNPLAGQALIALCSGMVLPWCVFITTTVYAHRQQLALIRQILERVTGEEVPTNGHSLNGDN